MAEPSARYRAALEATKTFHQTHKTFSGRFLLRYAPEIKKVIDEFDCKTMLDFGCGKGRQWKEPLDPEADPPVMMVDYLGVKPTLYDPGWPEYAAEPKGKFDIVVCTQVLGSIPIIDLPWVVNRLHSFAIKVVFVGESLGVCKKIHLNHMRGEMPFEYTHEDWAKVLRHPSGIPVFLQTAKGGGRIERVQ